MHTFVRALSIPAMLGMLLLASCKGGDKEVSLRLNLQPGSEYLYTTENKTEVATSTGQVIQSTKMLMVATYKVDAAAAGSRTLTVTYDRTSLEMLSPMGPIKYDSEDPSAATSPLAGLGNILHKPFSVTVSDNGEIGRVDGVSAIIDAAGDPNSPAGSAARGQMAAMFNDSSIRSMMQQSLNIFPGRPVKKGDSWKKTVSADLSGIRVNVVNTYQLKSVSDGFAHVDLNAVATAGGDMSSELMKDMQISLKGDSKGTLDIDTATGMVSDAKLTQRLAGDLTRAGNKIPVKITQDIHLSARKK